MNLHRALTIAAGSDVGEARREAMALAASVEMSDADVGKVALVVTEAATNIVKHAGSGQVLLRSLSDAADKAGVEMLALDKGGGMRDVARCLQDGYSTAGSPGTGLGAIARMSSLFDIYAPESGGTALLARILPAGAVMSPQQDIEVGAVRVPAPGEGVSGDDGGYRLDGAHVRVILADGLGHGGQAAVAASEAVRVWESNDGASIPDVLLSMHRALLSTRGAAVSMADIDLAATEVKFAGVGNVAGFVAWPGGSRNMATQNGTVGAQFSQPRVLPYPWRVGATLVLHTDGLNSRTTADDYPGLLSRHPSLIAGVLFRDFVRGRDDATVVVISDRKGAS